MFLFRAIWRALVFGYLSTLDIQAVNLSELTPDLVVPKVTEGAPGPGKRVKIYLPGNENSDLYHLVYLPTDWEKDKQYPVIVEYAGNKYKTSQGTVEGSSLGYGISEGKGVIWICMPFVNMKDKKNCPTQKSITIFAPTITRDRFPTVPLMRKHMPTSSPWSLTQRERTPTGISFHSKMEPTTFALPLPPPGDAQPHYLRGHDETESHPLDIPTERQNMGYATMSPATAKSGLRWRLISVIP